MEPTPYQSDFERQKKLLIDRYMRLRQNYVYDSSSERYQWQDISAKNRYHTDVKVNNWVEEQRDVDYLKHRRPSSTDYDYAYRTEYISRFGDSRGVNVIPSRSDPRCFPGHQPELDLAPLKQAYRSYETTSRVAYQDPGLMTMRKEEASCPYCKLQDGRIRN